VKLAMLRLQTLGRCRTAVRSFSTTTNWSKFWSNKWIEPEAEEIISRAYAQHQALIDHSTPQRPRVTHEELETLGAPFPSHPSPKIGDKIARNLVHGLTPFTHWFFRDKYNHHAVVLETVAAVPGFVGGMLRHFRSLRRMDRDHGWISTLLEDAENERMHLLTWMQVTQPTPMEKVLVVLAQGFYAVAFGVMYIISPGTAHRFVGYLEEEAVCAYTGLSSPYTDARC